MIERNVSPMAHDSDYFRRRAAEVRSAAFDKDDGESVEVAGHLALALSALARCGGKPAAAEKPDSAPLLLRD
ncbi:MAG: hypothetical protein H0V46_08235 [Sphingomonas sp.]|nr:hypothetical protein [Sphingomonas sp.]